MELVYDEGIAKANHHPRPRKKPFPSALTMSRTSLPSRCATYTLRMVRVTRKKVWSNNSPTSFEVKEGNTMRRIATSCFRNSLSTLGL